MSVNSIQDTIDCAELAPYRLRLRQPWNSTKGILSVRQGWLIKLGTKDGRYGYGDCAPLPEMGTETQHTAENLIRAELKGYLGIAASTAFAKMQNRLRETPAVRCGIETALIDLLAQRDALPVAAWLKPHPRKKVSVNAVAGAIDSGIASRVQSALDQGFKTIKLKIGIQPLAVEQQVVKEIVTMLPKGSMLRLDANGCWDMNQASKALSALRGLPVESLEEPLRSPRSELFRNLQALVPWPLALDESLPTWPLDDLFILAPVRRLVLKPMLLGGLLPSFELARRARRIGMECVVTTTIDSAVGVWAALHLAAALDKGLSHGLHTGTWLAEDVGDPPRLKADRMAIRNTPGLGFSPQAENCHFQTV